MVPNRFPLALREKLISFQSSCFKGNEFMQMLLLQNAAYETGEEAIKGMVAVQAMVPEHKENTRIQCKNTV